MVFVLRPRVTVDMDALLTAGLAYPGLIVVPRVEMDSLDTTPLLTYQLFNGHQIRNGPIRGGSEWTLALTLFTDNIVDGSRQADTVYQNLHDLEDADGVPGVGYVHSVDDVSMFDRVGSASLPDKRVVQYSATFTLIVHP
jgi:hypothetical protein